LFRRNKLSEIPSNVPRRTPAILVQGAAQDIVGVSRLLKAAGSDLQLESDIPYTEDGIFAVPERLGLATGVLYGPEVEFHLSPAMNQGAIRWFYVGASPKTVRKYGGSSKALLGK